MFAFFIFPATMAIGGAAVSVPIIIHLINRMRFRRIRWAAMEFLLKSQKRNRRRLIIEQIILLLLRCLLVVLVAFLLSRFLGCSGAGIGAQTTLHYVVLDDTLSMSDHWKDQGALKNSFEEGKRLIKEVAKNAAQAGAAQEFMVVRLSEPDTVLFDKRLNDETLRELGSTLDDLQCTELHVRPEVGVKAAREVFGQNKLGQRLLHFVSDFRTHDWAGPESNTVNQEVDALCNMGVQVFLVDAADPIRPAGNQAPLHHDNMGIVDLQAETKVAALGMPVQFTVKIQNFGKEKRDGAFLHVKVNGSERLEGSQPVPSLPEKALTTHTFQVAFNQEGFNQVTASLDNDDVGIDGDNKRFAVIEVRKQVEVLLVDGGGPAGMKPGGDSFYLQTVFTSARGYQVVVRGVEELDRPLDKYPSIFLLNIKEIKDKGLKNLEDYVRQGGNVAFFVGDQVRPTWYNAALYNNGKGLFPVPLADRPTEPLSPEEKIQKLLIDEQQKVFLRSHHPIFEDLLPIQTIFRYLVIDRYWPTLRRDKWNAEPGTLEELATLPNEKPVESYRVSGNELNNEIKKIIDEADPKYEKYLPGLKRYHSGITDALGGSQLYLLANRLEALLKDEGAPADKPDAQRPNLKEFWELPEQQRLRQEVDKFREVVQYGDPLVLVKRFGKGRAVAFLTTAGKSWNEWPGGCPASPTYPIVMIELEKFLTSGGEDTSRLVGEPLHFDLDASRYQAKLHRYYQPEVPDIAPAGAEPPPGKRAGLTDKGEQLGAIQNGRIPIAYDEAKKSGVYLFDFFPVAAADAAAEPKPEQRAYAFNVDTLAEGELQRALKDELERNPANPAPDRGKITLYTPRSDLRGLAQRQSDMSESPWVFLVLLVVLVLEQALAMHLSFHLKGNEPQLPSQVIRPRSTAA